MQLQLLLARRYLSGRLNRSILTTLAIALGAMIVFGMNGIVPAVRASFEAGVRTSAHEVDLVVFADTDRTFDAAVADQIRAVPGVGTITAVLERPVLLPAALAIPTSDGPALDALILGGWDPETSQAVTPLQLEQGRWLQPGDTNTMLVRASLLERTGLSVGSSVTLPAANGTAQFEIVGVLPERPIFGDEEVYVPLPQAQELLAMPGRINGIAGDIVETADEEAVRAAVNEAIGPGYTLGAVEAGSGEWEAVLQMAEGVFTMFGVLAMAMGGFIVFNTFRTSVAERRRDIGMLRAIGATRRTVLGIVLGEGIMLGVIGTLAGMLFGALAVTLALPQISPAWERFFGAPLGSPSFSAGLITLTVVLGLGVPLIGGLLPARAAARISPLEALRSQHGAPTQRNNRRNTLIGAIVLLVALAALFLGDGRLAAVGALLFLIGLAMLSGTLIGPAVAFLSRPLVGRLAGAGYLAERNLTRRPERAAATSAAMLISLAILVALGGLADTFTKGLLGYLDQSMRADYMLLPEALVLGQANVGADQQLAERLRTTPGITAVTTLRQTEALIAEQPSQLVGLNPITYPQLAGLVFSEGTPEAAYAALADNNTIIVNNVLAARGGITMGQEITLNTENGPRSYRVVGIGIDYLNSRVATAYVSQEVLARDFGITSDVLLMANRNPDTDPATFEASLVALTRDYPAFAVLDFAQWRAEQVAANQTRSNILYVLMAFLALPALIALANTLGISVLERTREIGTLRALGADRRQVRLMILAESLLLAALGALFGVIGGIGLGYGLVRALSVAGFNFAYQAPLIGIIVAVVVALVFGALAALAPARRAAALSPAVALRYE